MVTSTLSNSVRELSGVTETGWYIEPRLISGTSKWVMRAKLETSFTVERADNFNVGG